MHDVQLSSFLYMSVCVSVCMYACMYLYVYVDIMNLHQNNYKLTCKVENY